MRPFYYETISNKKPLWKGGWSFYDTHVKGRIYYRSTKKGLYNNRKPLYIALRAGKVEFIQRVLKIEHEVKLVDCCPLLKNVKESWPSEPHTVWHLSDPVRLPNAIPVGDNRIQSAHLFCDMDILLSSSSIKEARESMAKRRESLGRV